MAKYEIIISEEVNNLLKTISEESGDSIEEILQDFINNEIEDSKIDLVVNQYKKGNLKAMKAWKLSGLSFDEFNAIAKD